MNDSLHILLVDDQESLLFTYTLILQKQGHRVTPVSDCEQAMQHLDQGHFDLLICDLTLDGGRSGFEVLDFARHRCPAVRQVLLTGFPSHEVEQEAAGRGVTVLFKPVGVPDLLATVRILGCPQIPAAITEFRPSGAPRAHLQRQITS